jgi:hypothetical protein
LPAQKKTYSSGKRVSYISRIIFDGRIYFINPEFQTRFLFQIAFIIFFSLTLIYLANLAFFYTLAKHAEELGLDKGHIYFQMIADQKAYMNKIFIILGLCLSIFMILWGLIFSHRIAGPLHRLYKSLNKEDGKQALYFREDDFFQELSVAYNKCFDLDRVSTKISNEVDEKDSKVEAS